MLESLLAWSYCVAMMRPSHHTSSKTIMIMTRIQITPEAAPDPDIVRKLFSLLIALLS